MVSNEVPPELWPQKISPMISFLGFVFHGEEGLSYRHQTQQHTKGSVAERGGEEVSSFVLWASMCCLEAEDEPS